MFKYVQEELVFPRCVVDGIMWFFCLPFCLLLRTGGQLAERRKASSCLHGCLRIWEYILFSTKLDCRGVTIKAEQALTTIWRNYILKLLISQSQDFPTS